MDAASATRLQGRGASRLLEHFVVLDRVTSVDEPSGRARLESELGYELAELLLGALASDGHVPPVRPC